jgi:hypothetical protein
MLKSFPLLACISHFLHQEVRRLSAHHVDHALNPTQTLYFISILLPLLSILKTFVFIPLFRALSEETNDSNHYL